MRSSPRRVRQDRRSRAATSLAACARRTARSNASRFAGRNRHRGDRQGSRSACAAPACSTWLRACVALACSTRRPASGCSPNHLRDQGHARHRARARGAMSRRRISAPCSSPRPRSAPGSTSCCAWQALDEDAIERVVIAGAFGAYIDVRSAVAVGMLPDLPAERIAQVGNAAGSACARCSPRGTRARARGSSPPLPLCRTQHRAPISKKPSCTISASGNPSRRGEHRDAIGQIRPHRRR